LRHLRIHLLLRQAKILDLPFLFKSAEEAYEVVNSDIGEEIFNGLAAFGLVFLAEGDNGMRQISTTNRAVAYRRGCGRAETARRPRAKLLDVWTELGPTPSALRCRNLPPRLATGTAEGQDNATYHLVANATYDDIKYFSNITTCGMGCTMVANSVMWAKLTRNSRRSSGAGHRRREVLL
jgi:TRAP-type C4-dicarboxylate transport system substrate-binding protein